MYQVFDAWKVNVVINNQQGMKTTLVFAAKLRCSSIILNTVLGSQIAFYFPIKHFQVEQ